jgi:hypothetical protein
VPRTPERDDRDDAFEGQRPKLGKRDAWRLIFASYRVSFPYLFAFILAMLAVTWLLTNVIFR